MYKEGPTSMGILAHRAKMVRAEGRQDSVPKTNRLGGKCMN